MHIPSMRRRALRTTVAAVTTAVLVLVSGVPAWAMTVTFVRHAESQANADGVIDTSVPGPGLSELGRQQAAAVAPGLAANGYDGIYVSSMLRTQQTAQPLLDLLSEGTDYVILPGVREISAGVFEGSSEDEGLGRLGYALGPLAWTLGARFVPVPGGEDGNAFDARVDDALRQIHVNGDQNSVVFSHGATIMFWTMMNVDNPDLGLLLSHQLDNTDAVVIEGSPDEGWTLVSWAGEPVDAEPSLPTKLFVAVRNLVVAPQTALFEAGQAFATGDIAPLATTPEASQQQPSISPAPPLKPTAGTPRETENRSTAGALRNSGNLATSSTTKESNGATDLTDGNKTVPGQSLQDPERQSVGSQALVAATADVAGNSGESAVGGAGAVNDGGAGINSAA